MTDFNAQVTFSATPDQVVAALAAIQAKLEGTAASADGTSGAIQGIGASGQEASGGILQMVEAFGLAQIAVRALETVFEGVKNAVVGFVEMGIEFNRTIETAQIGIGALIATQNTLTDANGKALQGQEALNAGMELGEEQVTKLRLASFATVATFEQMVAAYQQALGPMQQAGVDLDQTVQMTQRFAQAAGALGLDINTLGHEMRATFSGQISPRITKIASALHIKREDIKAWSEAGTVVEEMNKRLEFFGLAGERVEASWQGVTSNVQHFFQAFSGESVKPLFDGLKTGLHDALHDAFNLSTGDFSEAFKGLLDSSKDIFGEIGKAAGDALLWLVGEAKDLSAWFKENRADVLQVAEAVRIVAFQVAGLLGDVTGIGAQTTGMLGPLQAISTLFEGIGLVVAVIRDTIRIIEAGVVSVGTVLLHGVLGPIQAVLMTIGQILNDPEGLGSVLGGHKGDAFFNKAQGLQDFINKGYELTNSLVKPFQEGKNAVAAFGDALLDAQAKREHLGDPAAVKSPSGIGHASNREKDVDKVAAEVLNNLQERLLQLKLEDLRASSAVTLEQERQKTDAEAEAKYLEEKHKLASEVAKSPTPANKATGEADRAEAYKVYQTSIAASTAKFNLDQKAAEDKIQNQLNQALDSGLAARMDSIKHASAKMLEEIKNSNTAKFTAAQVEAAQAVAIARENLKAVQDDIGKIRKTLEELAKEKGAPLTVAESLRALESIAMKSRTPEAIAEIRKELERTKDAGAGFVAGIQAFLARGEDLFMTFKTAVAGTLDQIQGQLAKTIEGVVSGTMKGGQAVRAFAKSIEMDVIGALARVAAQYLMTAVVGAAFGNSQAAVNIVAAGAAQELAAAEIWAAWAPFSLMGGEVAALTEIAAMRASVLIPGREHGGDVTAGSPYIVGEAGHELFIPSSSGMIVPHDLTSAMQMGASLARANAAQTAIVNRYSSLGASYASAAAHASQTASSRSGGGDVHNHYEGALIVANSLEGERAFDGHVTNSLQRTGRDSG
jgi:hypothetical protein